MNLEQLQNDFQNTVLYAECVGAVWVSRSKHGLSSKTRLSIYHAAYRLRLIDVLLDTFEHTEAYLGEQWFQKLAEDFVQTHNSTHNNIGMYGQGFPAFLAEQLPNDLDVAELALMDWTLRRAFDGPDSAVMTQEHLQQLASGQLVIRHLEPVPTLSITKQQFNTLDIWHAINQDERPPTAERLPKPVDVLVWRKGHSPHFQSLSPIESVAINSICQRNTLEAIGTALATEFPDIDAAAEFGQLLNHCISEQMLAALKD